MGVFKLNRETDCLKTEKEGKKIILVKKEKWEKFKSDILGLGVIGRQASPRDVICAFFDLEGFTKFCNRADSGEVIPVFLNPYLNWFFEQIREKTKFKEYDEGIATYHDLPFLIKFLGDGLMVLWDVTDSEVKDLRNIILSALEITENYQNGFFPKIKLEVGSPPANLRCGIAKGTVYSIGNGDGQDYVGTCINLASRLQKLHLPGIRFAFSSIGIPKEAFSPSENRFIKCSVDIRGIGENVIFILKREYDNLDKAQRKKLIGE